MFDLDGTLLDRDTSIEQFSTLQYDRLNTYLGQISKIDYISRFIALDCHGYVWKDKVYRDLVAEFKIELVAIHELPLPNNAPASDGFGLLC